MNTAFHHQANYKSLAFPCSLVTRNICITGLCASWITGVAGIVCGCLWMKDSTSNLGFIPVRLPSRTLKEIIPLLINIGITILTDGMGLIHSTALRWAMGSRLSFNSNLRLFTAVRGRVGFGRLSNFLRAGFLIVSYTAASFIFSGYPPTKVCDSTNLGVGSGKCADDGSSGLSVGAVLALGIGLTGEAMFATYQLFNGHVPTWSSSPLDTAWAAAVTNQRNRFEGRCIHSVHDHDAPSGPIVPRIRQGRAWASHPEVRRVIVYLWILVVLALAWFAALYGAVRVAWAKCQEQDPNASHCGVYKGTSWSLLPDTAGTTSLVDIDAVDSDYSTSASGIHLGIGITFIMIMGFQSVLTMGLHCAELLVNMSRDEDIWRETYGAEGHRPRNAVVTALKSWKTVLLFVLKPVVHWLFGLGMTFYIGFGIFMRPPQVLYLSFSLIFLAGFGTYLCFTRPSGPQPATFGHIQTLCNLVDEWHEGLYWGHKSQGWGNINHAGTAGKRLEEIRMDELYAM